MDGTPGIRLSYLSDISNDFAFSYFFLNWTEEKIYKTCPRKCATWYLIFCNKSNCHHRLLWWPGKLSSKKCGLNISCFFFQSGGLSWPNQKFWGTFLCLKTAKREGTAVSRGGQSLWSLSWDVHISLPLKWVSSSGLPHI